MPTVRSLSEFLRATPDHLQRLKASGEPEVLTVDGKVELVVQSAAAYQALLNRADDADAARVLRDRIAAADAGRVGVPARQVLDAMAGRLGLANRP